MKTVNLIQGTPDWIQWRSEGIGATDIPIIMEQSPYKTPYQLWEEKCGFLEHPRKFMRAIAHGWKQEDAARAWIEHKYGIHIRPLNIESNTQSLFRASLDGFNFDNGDVWEIKAPYTAENVAKYNESIPVYWTLQVQWQLKISGSPRAHLTIWDAFNDTATIHTITPEPELWEIMEKKALEFWDHVRRGIPPKLSSSDVLVLEDQELGALIDEYRTACKEEDILKDRKIELKEKIFKYSPERDFKAFGATVKWRHQTASLDTDAMKADGINIEKYRRPTPSRVRAIYLTRGSSLGGSTAEASLIDHQ